LGAYDLQITRHSDRGPRGGPSCTPQGGGPWCRPRCRAGWFAGLSRRVRASLNPFLEPDPAGSAPDPGIFAFHRLLPGYAPTPLHSCAHLAAELGIGGLFIKDESQRFGLNAFKGLGAVWALHRLTAAGASPKTVAAA